MSRTSWSGFSFLTSCFSAIPGIKGEAARVNPRTLRAGEVFSDRGHLTNRLASLEELDKLCAEKEVCCPLHASSISSMSISKRGGPVNEDSYLCERLHLANGQKCLLACVFDGHGNGEVAEFLRTNVRKAFVSVYHALWSTEHYSDSTSDLASKLSGLRSFFPSNESFTARRVRLKELKCSDTISLALCATLAVLEENAMAEVTVDTVGGGSTATLVVVMDSTVHVAACGDASAAIVHSTRQLSTVISEKGPSEKGQSESSGQIMRPLGSRLIFQSSDHRALTRPDEASRVVKEGGKLRTRSQAVGTHVSSISVTRSLGDTMWKSGDEWTRDKTIDRHSGRPAIDRSMARFSKANGFVGLSSDPEWYVVDTCESKTWGVETNAPSDVLPRVAFGCFGHAGDDLASKQMSSAVIDSSFLHLLLQEKRTGSLQTSRKPSQEEVSCVDKGSSILPSCAESRRRVLADCTAGTNSEALMILVGSDGFWDACGLHTGIMDKFFSSATDIVAHAKKSIGPTPRDDATLIAILLPGYPLPSVSVSDIKVTERASPSVRSDPGDSPLGGSPGGR